MNLFNIYKKSLQIILSNPLITTYLVLFFIISSIFLGRIFASETKIIAMILCIGLIALNLCFASGWLYVIKNTITAKETSKSTSLSIFFEGVGKNIIPLGIGSLLYSVCLLIILFLTSKFASNVFGSLDFILKDFSNIIQDKNALIQYLLSLNDAQKQILAMHEICITFSGIIFIFSMLFYFPAIIFNEKTHLLSKPIIAIKDALVFLFQNFINSLLLFICIYIIHAFLQILGVLFDSNFILSTIILIFNIYFISITIMLIFNYYGYKNNCNNGCNSIRED